MFSNLSPVGTIIFLIVVIVISAPIAIVVSEALERKFGIDTALTISLVWMLIVCGKAIFS